MLVSPCCCSPALMGRGGSLWVTSSSSSRLCFGVFVLAVRIMAVNSSVVPPSAESGLLENSTSCFESAATKRTALKKWLDTR